MMKKAVKWIGRALMLLSIIFIVQKLFSYRDSLNVNLSVTSIFFMGICVLAYGAIVYVGTFLYKCLLRITTDCSVPFNKVAYVCCKANIMKYLPGNVMQYVGRNEIAVEENLPHTKVALATIMEIIIVVLSTGVVAICFSGSYAIEWINNFVEIKVSMVVVLALLVMAIIAVILLIFKDKIIGYFKTIITVKNIASILGLIVYYGLIMIANSILYFYVLSLMDIFLEPKYYLIGIGLYSLSFVLGYVTPGVPGGIGIREAVLVYFFSSFIAEAQILSGAVIFRIISILGDFVAIGLAMVVNKFVSRKQETSNDN